jgi:lysophospholipase L1-like esterase
LALYDISFSRRLREPTLGCVLVILSLIAVDRICALFVSPDDQVHQLVLPPLETARYEFRDFRFTVSTNRLGFRGPDFPVHRTPGVKRILVFGNSFTYGWGVDFEETWPHLLEQELSAAGISAQVANLSRAATNGMEMKEVVERSIPLLKPDLIIISVLQGGVLTTLQSGVAPNPAREREKNVKGILVNWLSYVMPNYVHLLQVARQRSAAANFIPASVMRREQIRTAESFTDRLTGQERRRLYALDPGTVDRFVKGELNPGIVLMAVQTPNFWVDTVKSTEMINSGVTGMRETLSAIGKIAEANGVSVVVASMPYGAYLGGGAAENLRRLGFNIPDFLDHDRSTEDLIRRAADEVGLQFISVLDGFQAVTRRDLFIPFDGHFSPAGTELFAKLLSKELARKLPLLAHSNSPRSKSQN